MKNVKFTIEDSELAELLGRQNFSTKESAVFELVKNSYDAGSKSCHVYIENNCIQVVDSGDGMSKNEILNNWMHVGKSSKGYQDELNKRVLTGSKGIGRFALARLGDFVKVRSKKIDNEAILWETDWIDTKFKETSVEFKKGTYIEIFNLRDKWRAKDVDALIKFLKKAYKSEKMKIFIYFDEVITEIESIYKNIKIGVDYVTKINMNFNSTDSTLKINIESDEFKPEVAQLTGINHIQKFSKEFFMDEEFDSKKEDNDTKFYLSKLGDFTVDFYFFVDKQPIDIAQKFMYKYNTITGIDTGIALYRNDFSISSLEGKKDWLEINSRARKSPAAATHLTGSWRVRYNQIFGYVTIDKKENNNLKDMSSRQGIEENEYYNVFLNIIQFGLGRFEKYRQEIIRKIDKNNVDKNLSINNDKKQLNDFLKKPSSVVKMSQKEITLLATEIKGIQKIVKEQSKVFKDNEQRHKYDVRILNVLATQGLRASSISHELHNKRNALATGYEDIVRALKEYGFWEELNSEEYTRLSYKNVPKILNELSEINNKLIAFLDVILNRIEKNKFNSKIDSIENALRKIVGIWKQQYNWIDFEININNEVHREYKLSADVLEVIFDNLILNSIQHNEMKDRLLIIIKIRIEDEKINFQYSDNGIGLHKKYIEDPKRILEVHESSRDDGHGLGMWIVNNTLNMYDGEVSEIYGENGFKINLMLKG